MSCIFDTSNLSPLDLSILVNFPLKVLTKLDSETDHLINGINGVCTFSQLVDSTLSRGEIIKVIPSTSKLHLIC